MTRTLIRGGRVLTMSGANHAQADVLIDGDTIAEVGTRLRARDAEVIDAADSIVMPGFVDAHRHLWETLSRNSGDGHPVKAETYAPALGGDDLYAATLVGLLGAADAGITTVVDCCGAIADSSHIDAVLQAHADSGLRSVFAMAGLASDAKRWTENLRRRAGTVASPLRTLAAAPPLPTAGDLASITSGWDTARELGLRIHAHARTVPDDPPTAAPLTSVPLGPDVTVVGCSHLGEADLDAVESAGAAVALTASSDMAAGLGSPPIQGLVDRGIIPGLGVDNERLSPGDLFAEMRAVISLQHATAFDRKLAGKARVPRLLSTRDVIRYATVEGARVAGLEGITGAIEPGLQADLMLLRADRPNIHPVNDPIGAVVWGMDTSNIDWVFVAGEAVKREGQIVGDAKRARDLAMAASRRVAKAAAMLAGAGGER